MRVAKGSTRLRSAKFIELLSSRTRPMRTGNAGLGSRPVVVVGSALGVGGASAVFCAVAPGFMSFATFKVLSGKITRRPSRSPTRTSSISSRSGPKPNRIVSACSDFQASTGSAMSASITTRRSTSAEPV
jgi:hypothetical protein